jgi:hypothetical protein
MSRGLTRPFILLISFVSLVTLLLPAESSWAASTSSPLQQQIDKQIKTYGGVQISSDTVSYNGGAVRLVFPHAGSRSVGTRPSGGASPQLSTTSYWYGCPYGYSTHWYCFYQDINFGGRMLEFKDCGSSQYLSNYGFANQASSWVNTSSHNVEVFEPSYYLAWNESPYSASSWVGSAANDRAVSFYTSC